LAPFKITSEEPRVTVQVGPITYLVLPDFSGKLYPSQISMVEVDGLLHQLKRKDSLFKFKILIKVNFKIQVTK
jgi:hypothetical protein